VRVYLINLDRAPERREHMESQFTRLGLACTRVEAVDAKVMSSQEVEAFRHSVADTRRPHAWSLPQIGNFLSHKKVWSAIASGSDGFAAVFEDDVHLSDRMSRS
jgi:glycosyl transferase family 25